MKKKPIAVYIASPYTIGDIALNVRKSIEVANRLLELGYIPFVPLLSHFWHLISPKPHQEWMELDFEWVLRCDCVLRVSGVSSGADAEVELAAGNDIPVFYSIKDLVQSTLMG